MGLRGPKSVSRHDLLDWEREWVWLFSRLRDGFPGRVSYEWVIPDPPKLQIHPILLDELKKKPMIATRKERTSEGYLSEKRIWLKLLSAKTVREVRKACRGSRYWARAGAKIQDVRAYYLLTRVCDLALALLAAKQDRRFPKSERPTSKEKRLRFLARDGGCMCRCHATLRE